MALRATLTIFCSLTVSACMGAGAMAATRLSTEGNVYLINPYTNPAETYYGFRIATGDFNGDDIDDMAVAELGASTRFRVLLGKSYPIGGPYPLARFTAKTVTTPSHGSVLATGDFNGDGVDEVAIGDRDSVSNPGGGGTVYIFRRSATDTWSLQEIIRQGLNGYNGVDTAGDRFGNALASGDFDGDGYDDLAIGVSGKESTGSPVIQSAGAVQIVYGSTSGLSGARDRVFTSLNDGLGFSPDNSDQYGYALAVGNFDADAHDDLAIGVVQRGCPNGGERAGGVVILKGSSTLGLSTVNAQSFQPGQSGILGNCASRGYFGAALSAGRVNGQSFQGLAIGAPLADVGGVEKTGAVHLLFGGAGGITVGGNQFISVTDLPGGESIPFLQFGNQVKPGRLRTTTQSLVIGSPNQTVNGLPMAGALWILHSGNGSATITPAIAERWTGSGSLGIGPPAANDNFGNTIAIGDFNGDGMDDLATGAYQHAMGGDAHAGGGQVIYQSEFIFRDDFQ
ncbi:MAG: FG-GAP repeat protein [Tahibacter sp.]